MRDKWLAKQKNIHAGLASIGEEIAGFYEGGLQIYYDNLSNGAYFLIHAAREIECGLRDIFAVDFEPDDDEKNRHKKEIFYSLGERKSENLALDWYRVSKKLHKFAHRHGAWKKPRLLEEAKPIWVDFEYVLEKLVGSYYAVIERIEHIGRIDNIDKGATDTLCNMLKIPVYYKYFFRKETNIKWFSDLFVKGFFDPSCIDHDLKGNTLFWDVLDYLERVSEQVVKNLRYGKELVEIIDSLVKFSIKRKEEKGQGINNYHIWWYCVKILNNIPNKAIAEYLSPAGASGKYNFRQWLSAWIDNASSSELTISDIGEKLLGKFLNDKSMLPFAEVIIDAITGTRAGKKEQDFTVFPNREKTDLIWNSYWLLKTFGQYHKQIGEKCSTKTIVNIADKLKIALVRKQSDHSVIFTIGKDVYQVKVYRVPVKDLKDGEVGFKKSSYLCSVKQYTPNQIKDIDLKGGLYALVIKEPEGKPRNFSFSAKSKKKFISELQRKLPPEIAWQEAEDFDKKLEDLFDSLYEDYSRVWFKSMADGGSDHASGAKEVLTIILRDTLLASCKAERVEVKSILESFLSDDYRFPIFKKFVLLCIDKYWERYADLFKKFIVNTPRVLGNSDWEVELQDLFRHHNKRFGQLLINKLKELINDIPDYYREERKKYEAAWKHKWLSPLKDNPAFSDMYAESSKQAGQKAPYVPDRITLKCGFISHKSPLLKEKVLSKPIVELISFLKSFKGVDTINSAFEEGPDREGLGDALQAAVKENPKKFTDEIDMFYDAPYYYVHHLLWGFRDAANAKQDLEWGKIIRFSHRFIKRPNFIKEALAGQGRDRGKGKYIWVIDDIAGLIQSGSAKDNKTYDQKYFDEINQIFDEIVPLLISNNNTDSDGDALTYALNTTLGKVIEAFIVFSLLVSGVTNKKLANWGNAGYARFFEKGIEAYVWLGRYLPNINYLDNDFVRKKINALSAPNITDKNWQALMEGYLKGADVYDDLYLLMRQNYIKAIENQITGDYIDKRLVQHIALGYIRGTEEIDKKNKDGQASLFRMTLEDVSTSEKRMRWLRVVSFFRTLSKKALKNDTKDKDPSKKMVGRILEFWKWTFKNKPFVKKKLREDYNSFLGRLAGLTILLPEINEEAEKLLMLSSPHIERYQSAPFFIECLIKFTKKDELERIGRIYLEMLKNTTPYFQKENIQTIIRRMYETKDAKIKEYANEICNTYGRRGIHFLKDLFYEYNKN